jgi:hypothetical protein
VQKNPVCAGNDECWWEPKSQAETFHQQQSTRRRTKTKKELQNRNGQPELAKRNLSRNPRRWTRRGKLLQEGNNEARAEMSKQTKYAGSSTPGKKKNSRSSREQKKRRRLTRFHRRGRERKNRDRGTVKNETGAKPGGEKQKTRGAALCSWGKSKRCERRTLAKTNHERALTRAGKNQRRRLKPSHGKINLLGGKRRRAQTGCNEKLSRKTAFGAQREHKNLGDRRAAENETKST